MVMDMAELWEIYDKCRKKTGRTMKRGKNFGEGEYHLVVHIWPMNAKGEFLIQKRQENVAWRPGIWAATGGSAIAGETALEAAIRELEEELGITGFEESMEFMMEIKRHDSLCSIWLIPCEASVGELTLQKEEVSDAKWASREDIHRMIQEETFYAYDYLEMLFQLLDQREKFHK